MCACVFILRKRAGRIFLISLVSGECETLRDIHIFVFCISVLLDFSMMRMLTSLKEMKDSQFSGKVLYFWIYLEICKSITLCKEMLTG